MTQKDDAKIRYPSLLLLLNWEHLNTRKQWKETDKQLL